MKVKIEKIGEGDSEAVMEFLKNTFFKVSISYQFGNKTGANPWINKSFISGRTPQRIIEPWRMQTTGGILQEGI